jgi:hypothetical protein
MVVGQSTKAMANAAVLALEIVTHGDVDPRELDGAPAADDCPQQPYDGRHLDGDADTANIFVVLLDDFDLTIEDHADSPLPADDAMGLIALV